MTLYDLLHITSCEVYAHDTCTGMTHTLRMDDEGNLWMDRDDAFSNFDFLDMTVEDLHSHWFYPDSLACDLI